MRVQGSQEKVAPIEINIDTVYIRKNIHRIKDLENDKELWEYDEEQIPIIEYFKKIIPENEDAIGELSAIFSAQQQQYDKAIAELNILIGSLF